MKYLTKQNRSLLRELVITDFKLRYQGSVLGYLWSLLRPLLLFTILYVVFSRILHLGKDVPHYPAYLLLGIVLWTYFIEATTLGMSSIVVRGPLIRKVNFPKYIIVLSSTLSAFINLVLNLVVVVIFLILGRVPLHLSALLLPVLLVELMALTMSISFFLSALYIKYRDFSHIWEIALQALFYATPILYTLTIVPVKIRKIMALSPLTQIIQDARKVLISPDTVGSQQVLPHYLGWALPPLLVIIAVLIAANYFRQRSKYFAEDI